MIIAYDGAPYHGLQRNRDVHTVADVFEKALHSVGAISDENLGHLEKIKWQASARTDRGVSAAGNVISLKLLFDKAEIADASAFAKTTERVNRALPHHVRLFAIAHITGSFSARSACGERWYEYLLPMSALGEAPALHKFQQTLRAFEGTHAFHNYTVGEDHSVPPRSQAKRYIVEATCDEQPFTLRGGRGEGEYVRIRVKGQSFMLHQIRKMVSMAVLSHVGLVDDDAIQRSFCKNTLINIPPAPAVGLFLDCCLFDAYNSKYKQFLPEPLKVDDYRLQREDFKRKFILPSIAQREKEEDALEVFFRTVEAHPVQFE